MKVAMSRGLNAGAAHSSASSSSAHDSSTCADTADVGILLFNTAPRLMYMDVHARALSADISLWESGYSANGILPTSLTMLVTEIVKRLEARSDANDPRPFEVRRLLSHTDRPMLLRGYGFPHGIGTNEGRVMVLIEEMTPRKEICSRQAAERFHLTLREEQVVQNLSKGYTNKEIASALDITEQAVKEVIKRIMQKTNTTTRTGILIKILRA